MKKFASLFFVVVLSIFSINSLAATNTTHSSKAMSKQSAQKNVTLYFFWSHDCPHCSAAHPYIDKLKSEYSWLKVRSFEISQSQKNQKLFEQMAKDHGKETSFVPTFFVGDKMIVGYTDAATTGAQIRDAVVESHNAK